MDKETLIRLATPASIALLATSIFSFPIISNASFSNKGTKNDPIHIACVYKSEYGYYHSIKC